MKRSLFLFPLLALLASTTTAQDIQGPSWTPTAFSVSKPDKDKNGFGAEPGTRVTARLVVPGRQIIQIDPAKGKIVSFTDDKNTELMAAPAGGGFPNRPILSDGFGSRSKPGDVTFHAPGVPAKGASKVRVEGSVVVLVGKDEKELEKKDISLKTGGDFDFGTLKASEAPGGFGAKTDRGMRLTLEGSKPIQSITLLDAEGKEITTRTNSFPSPRPPAADAKPQFRSTIFVTGTVIDRCTIKVKYFNSVDEITVPIDLEVGPGL